MVVSNNLVRIGVIGAGHLGRFHIECIERIDGFTLTGFYDVDENRAHEISAAYHVNAFDSLHSLLANNDAVCIVTPTRTHYELGLEVINAGKHLFIEKPLTDNPATSFELSDRILEKGLIGRVGHVERYNPAYVAAKKFGLNQPVFIEAHRLAP